MVIKLMSRKSITFHILILLLVLNNCYGEETAPKIIEAPKDQVVIANRVASFVCKVTGNPKPQIEWRKNGKPIVTQRYSLLEIPKGSVLRVEPVRTSRDNATYECLAENGVGEPVRAQASLTVISDEEIPRGFPKFTIQPNMQGIERGRKALIPCKAEGDPEPTISWIKDLIPIDMSNSRYTFYQGASLQIQNTEESDQGYYECVAENKIGTAYSESATLHVRNRVVPPYFSIPPEALYEVMPGSSLNVTCVAVGSPMPIVTWKKGHSDIVTDSAPPVGKNVLRIEDAKVSANYTCVASSKLGQIEAQTRVIVQALPRAPINLKYSDVTSQSVRLTWSYESGAENIIYYVVQYKPKNSNQPLLEISGITTFFVVINSLTPYTEYEFFVIAVNSIGRGAPSASVTLTTGESEPGDAPRNLEARPLSSTNILVRWDPPEAANGPVTGYKVHFTTTSTLPLSSWQAQAVDSNELTTISDLQPQMIYTIRVAAITARGTGPLSAPVQVKTQQGVPSQPKGLRAVSISATTVQLAWKKPHDVGESVIGYEIYWNDTFTLQQTHRSIPNVESFILGELHPDTLYFVWVSAKSRRGEGAPTPMIPVRTEQYGNIAF